ncbi:hypothetical protein CEP54_008636 [Fusarium duplospermum]|uniref:Uncharacterized protein n=1 Tax=Fusarium duplospermum TaxID=1325734 RepID=A0A428PUW0_9HYPO|nr:hypothetical protein CEP54_008636 [Fusarium duplospermum]
MPFFNFNRIVGVVCTSPSRTKSDFDTLTANIEDAWYKAFSASKTTQATEAKRFIMVTFLPMVTIREGGMAIPEAGQEGGWLKPQLPYIRMMSGQRLGDFTDLLRELQDREDLGKMVHSSYP